LSLAFREFFKLVRATHLHEISVSGLG